MQRISSNLTLFLKIFLPVFWLVFFGMFTLAVGLTKGQYFGGVPAVSLKLGILFGYLLVAAAFWFSVIQLKRVEIDPDFLYASNYFKTYRYPFHNIEKITERDLWLFTLVRVHLKTSGNFGKRFSFLLDEAMLKDFLVKNPEVAQWISLKG